MSTYDIAKIVERDPKRIWEKLRDFGIPTRPRGLNLATTEDNYMRRPGAVSPWIGHRHTAEAKAKLSRAASRPKPWLRGRCNGMFGRTGPANPNWKGGISPNRQAFYETAEWKAFASSIYRRDRRICRRCGRAPVGERAIHLHHVRSWTRYPALRMVAENVVTLCRACHDWTHSRENVERHFLAD